jgi:hypothetical protein
LRHDFGYIFDHLYKIRETEGVSPNEGCMGQSPFTGISITRDYHCNVHSDTNDFSYSFFIWLGADGKSFLLSITYFALTLHLLCTILCVTGTDVNGKGVRFHIPELQMYFEPKIGDVMLIKTSIIQHSTRSRGSVGQLGMCAYMQASFFPMWQSIQDDIKILQNGGKLNEQKMKIVKHWIENNALYQKYT